MKRDLRCFHALVSRMANFLRLTNSVNGDATLINMDNVVTIHREGDGCRFAFLEPDRTFKSSESFDFLVTMLVAGGE